MTNLYLQIRVGMSIGHSPHVGPHKPDMKKDEGEITLHDRQEAKRRIEGSLAPDVETEGSSDPGIGGLSSLTGANLQ